MLLWRQNKILRVIVASSILVIMGCAGAEIYELNCVDIASAAGHSYERQFGEPAYVCVGDTDTGKYHAQAYAVEDGVRVWLTLTHGTDAMNLVILILAVGVDQELATIDFCVTLEEFDKMYG